MIDYDLVPVENFSKTIFNKANFSQNKSNLDIIPRSDVGFAKVLID
jgi:hypothetical protein